MLNDHLTGSSFHPGLSGCGQSVSYLMVIVPLGHKEADCWMTMVVVLVQGGFFCISLCQIAVSVTNDGHVTGLSWVLVTILRYMYKQGTRAVSS